MAKKKAPKKLTREEAVEEVMKIVLDGFSKMTDEEQERRLRAAERGIAAAKAADRRKSSLPYRTPRSRKAARGR